MWTFLVGYTRQLWACIAGSVVSALLVLYGLLSGGKGLPPWIAFTVFVMFMVGTTFRVREEEIRKRRAVEKQMEKQRSEYLGSVGLLQQQLKQSLENLDGCPRAILGYDEKTAYGFFVKITVADGRNIQLEPAESTHYRLTAEPIHHAVNGIPAILEMHAELISDEPGFIKSADGREAWKVIAQDLWLGKFPLDASNGDASMLAQFANNARAHTLAIPLRIRYWDFSGNIRYTSAAEVEWEAMLGSVVEVRPGAITKELI